jgi:hypothetical protein
MGALGALTVSAGIALGACAGDIGAGAESPAEGAPRASGGGPRAAQVGAGGVAAPAAGAATGATAGEGAVGATIVAPGVSGTLPSMPADPNAAGRMPLRGLSRDEYANTLRDLLGVTPALAGPAGFASDASAAGFATLGLVSDVGVKSLQQLSEQVSGRADVRKLVPCTLPVPAAGEAACAESFIKSFGRRAFRRPLASSEVDDYKRLFTAVLRQQLALPFEGAIRGLIEAMLQSPLFLYHWELGAVPAAVSAPGGIIKLGPHEVAARLSYTFWSTMPDGELMAAADGGALAAPAAVEAQARRLLKAPRSRDALRSFVLQWLRVEDVASLSRAKELYPAWSSVVGQAMEDELVAFALAVLLDGDGKFPSLLAAPFGFANRALAPVYGLPPTTSAALVRVELDPARRSGLLTRPAFLAATANAYEGDPTKRGIVVREQLVCQELVAPPMNVPPLPPPAPNVTTRERHARHFETPACRGCHELTDLIGFGLGNFDAIGAYQITERGKPIDASGALVNVDGVRRPFRDVKELVDLIAASDELRGCVARQWLRFAFRRTETDADAHSLQQAFEAFKRSGWDVRELLVAFAASRSFLYRAAAPGEVTR